MPGEKGSPFLELRMHFSGDVISTTGRGAGGDQLVRERERDERREVGGEHGVSEGGGVRH